MQEEPQCGRMEVKAYFLSPQREKEEMKLGSQAMMGNREPLIFLESDRIRYALKKDHYGSCVMEKLEWAIQGNQLGNC